MWIQLEDGAGGRVHGTFQQASSPRIQPSAGDWLYPLSGRANGDEVTLTTGRSSNGGPSMGSFPPFKVTHQGILEKPDGETYLYRNSSTTKFNTTLSTAEGRWRSE